MTVNNNKIIYKIEVEGIESHSKRLPVDITAGFIVGEIVTGSESGASAVVAEVANIGDPYIKIKTKIGFYFTEEALSGSVSGAATKIADTETTSELYNNEDYGIEDGLWAIYSDQAILTGMDKAVQSINISEGGNLGTGYKFGFSVQNIDSLAELINVDGVYFRQRKCTLFVGFVDGFTTIWSSEWVGAIKTIKVSGELEVKFNCGDLTNGNIEKIGSEELPICLNRNYSCKLILDDEITTNYINKVVGADQIIDGLLTDIQIDASTLDIIGYDTGDYSTGVLDNFGDGFLEISMGGGAGESFTILKTEIKQVIPAVASVYTLWLDGDLTNLVPFATGVDGPSTARIVARKNKYNLSQKEVKEVHQNLTSNISKPLTVRDGDNIEKFLSSPIDYNGVVEDGNQKVELLKIDNEDNVKSFALQAFPEDLEFEAVQKAITPGNPSGQYTFNISISGENKTLMNDFIDNNGGTYFNLGQVWLNGSLSAPTTVSIDGGELSNTIALRGTYKSTIAPNTVIHMMEVTPIVPAFSNVGTAVVVDYDQALRSAIEFFEIEDFGNTDVLEKLEIVVRVTFEVGDGSLLSEYNTIDNYNAGITDSATRKLDDISIGCNGENVALKSVDIDTVGNTIIYLLEEYYKIPTANIDLPSFTQADLDFSLFVNDPVRNPAHQIAEQTNARQLLIDLLYSHNLGLFINRDGKYQLSNWLPKSIVFSDTTPDIVYSETEFNSLSNIVRDEVNHVITDYELKFNYSEAEDKYLNTIRIKNTNEDVFNFVRDTEGVDEADEGLAFSAWLLGKAGDNRINKQSQTVKSNKWIKTFFSDGQGTSEAVAFIRNILAHKNRPHEVARVINPYNTTNLSKELLTLIAVSDQKITADVERNGWITERVLDTKTHQLEHKVLLDINKFDVFLERVNVWRDGSFPSNIKQDGSNPTNIKINGNG